MRTVVRESEIRKEAAKRKRDVDREREKGSIARSRYWEGIIRGDINMNTHVQFTCNSRRDSTRLECVVPEICRIDPLSCDFLGTL